MSHIKLGIMGAEPKEVEGIVQCLEQVQTTQIGMRDYHEGLLNGKQVVVVYSRCGKPAAAATVSALIHEFQITELIFTGVAGALQPAVQIGDIVISNRLVQHDVDVRPFRPQFEIPILGIQFFDADKELQSLAKRSIDQLIVSGKLHFEPYLINNPTVHLGDIASGDQFISTLKQKNAIRSALPTVLCTEMEGAAVAQICYEYDLPFVVIRTISDSADESADIDFPVFLEQVASKYSRAIIQQIINNR